MKWTKTKDRLPICGELVIAAVAPVIGKRTRYDICAHFQSFGEPYKKPWFSFMRHKNYNLDRVVEWHSLDANVLFDDRVFCNKGVCEVRCDRK